MLYSHVAFQNHFGDAKELTRVLQCRVNIQRRRQGSPTAKGLASSSKLARVFNLIAVKKLTARSDEILALQDLCPF